VATEATTEEEEPLLPAGTCRPPTAVAAAATAEGGGAVSLEALLPLPTAVAAAAAGGGVVTWGHLALVSPSSLEPPFHLQTHDVVVALPHHVLRVALPVTRNAPPHGDQSHQ
jgi:hypothetical protein